ncbi:MAG: type III secretion system inner membrane ring subunit SctD [Puniceicoccales bacterium]|jgi:type III secretion protein D|nr:type III secretion system inner membrane ring subunit SctD [Puniceicoccales bacterium]
MALLLKILSGPHQGAEFALPDEAIIVGSEDSCDLVLSDALVVDKHVKILKTANSKFELEPMNGNVFIDGHLVEGKTVGDIFKFITLGTTQLMIGPENDDGWGKISLASAPILDPIEDKKDDPEGVSKKSVNGNSSTEIRPKRKTSFYFLMFFYQFLIALTLSITIVFFSKNKRVKTAVDPILEIKSKIADLKIPGTSDVKKLEDGSIYVTGYVSLMAQSARIKAEINSIYPNAKVKVYSGEKISATVDEILREAKIDVKFDEITQGKFVVSGYVFNPVRWDRMKHRILEEVKGLVDFEDNVLTQTKVLKTGGEILKKYSLDDKIRFSCSDTGVTVGGTLTERDKNNWLIAKEDIEKNINVGTDIVFLIKMSADTSIGTEKYFGGKIDSIVYNENGLEWINMRDGRKYFEGSVLPSGYIIDNIEKDFIVIKGPDGTVTVDVEHM